MVRRRIAEDPVSRLAVWARWLALFALVATLVSIVVVRSGLLEVYPALATFGGALVLAALAILLAFASFVPIWRDGLRGLGHALTALFIGVALLSYPAYLGLKAYRLPAISDVTTDPIDPPRFETIARLRPRAANRPEYAGLYAATLQRSAYPDIEPLVADVDPKAAYDAAMEVVTRRKWNIVDAREPLARGRDGHIEAVARTLIMGFRDDIVIRIRPDRDGARIDVRSASRYGRHDFGTNAARIRALLADIDDATGAPVPARKTPQPKSQQVKGQTPAKR
jgi:uncharacterized protein (DUF1499 family)